MTTVSNIYCDTERDENILQINYGREGHPVSHFRGDSNVVAIDTGNDSKGDTIIFDCGNDFNDVGNDFGGDNKVGGDCGVVIGTVNDSKVIFDSGGDDKVIFDSGGDSKVTIDIGNDFGGDSKVAVGGEGEGDEKEMINSGSESNDSKSEDSQKDLNSNIPNDPKPETNSLPPQPIQQIPINSNSETDSNFDSDFNIAFDSDMDIRDYLTLVGLKDHALEYTNIFQLNGIYTYADLMCSSPTLSGLEGLGVNLNHGMIVMECLEKERVFLRREDGDEGGSGGFGEGEKRKEELIRIGFDGDALLDTNAKNCEDKSEPVLPSDQNNKNLSIETTPIDPDKQELTKERCISGLQFKWSKIHKKSEVRSLQLSARRNTKQQSNNNTTTPAKKNAQNDKQKDILKEPVLGETGELVVPDKFDLPMICQLEHIYTDFLNCCKKNELHFYLLLSIDLFNYRTMAHFPRTRIVERAYRILTKWFQFVGDAKYSLFSFISPQHVDHIKEKLSNPKEVNHDLFDYLWVILFPYLRDIYLTLIKKKTIYTPKNIGCLRSTPPVPDSTHFPMEFSDQGLFYFHDLMQLFSRYLQKKEKSGELFELYVALYNFSCKVHVLDAIKPATKAIAVKYLGCGKEPPKVESEYLEKIRTKIENNDISQTIFQDLKMELEALLQISYQRFAHWCKLKPYPPEKQPSFILKLAKRLN
eukprot:TRINITY_DN4730_c0_g1_i1.p1 TRINITY_DN4730_c0_g1~~TRINITY_DN4730_c0_g1_i1.p1  ORF type:complete len:718 (+),score=203.08 TRINITY_DN4730_c0_g1_i1:63-2156(+)